MSERQRLRDFLNERLLLIAELIAMIESHERPDPNWIRVFMEEERRTIETLIWGLR